MCSHQKPQRTQQKKTNNQVNNAKQPQPKRSFAHENNVISLTAFLVTDEAFDHIFNALPATSTQKEPQ